MPASVRQVSVFSGCKGPKPKPNTSTHGVGSLDLSSGIHGVTSDDVNYFLDGLLQISEDGVIPGGLAFFLSY